MQAQQYAGQTPPTTGQSDRDTPPTRLGSLSPPDGAARAAPAASPPARRPYLYVGQLSSQVNDAILSDFFSAAGPVQSTKIVTDRASHYPSALNYGFVEYADVRSAELALQKLNGRRLFESDIKVDWAASSLVHAGGGGSTGGIGDSSIGSSYVKENTSNHFHVFVGDIAPEINDVALRNAFHSFPSLSEARIMWDVTSGKSRGYGFVAFRDRTDAEQAIATMNGEWIGSRAIRVNWANQKGNGGQGAAFPAKTSLASAVGNGGDVGLATGMLGTAASYAGLGGNITATSMPPTGGAASGIPISYEQVLASSPHHNTTVYVGNIAPIATQNDLIPLFSQHGYILEIRMQPERGFAFVKLDTHENAASAIVNLAGQIACGRPIKCGWGKDRNESAIFNALRQGIQMNAYAGGASSQPMFAMPQYAFPGGFAAAYSAQQQSGGIVGGAGGGLNGTSTMQSLAMPGHQIDLATLQHLQFATQSQAVQQQQQHLQQQPSSSAEHLASPQNSQRQKQPNVLQYLHNQQAFMESNADSEGSSSFPA